MDVREVMTPAADTVTIDPDAPLSRAVHLLTSHRIAALPVVNATRALVGLIAERDVIHALGVHGGRCLDMPVHRTMRAPPLCRPDDPVMRIMERMTWERSRHFLVVDGEGQLSGIVSVGDLVKHRLHELELEAGVLRDYVSAHRIHG
jgi:CBS domain-containing protein